MAIINGHQELVDSTGQHLGYLCGNPSSDTKFPHSRRCPRKGKLFIRVVLTEIGTEYLCSGCKRSWNIISDGERPLSMSDSWWGWPMIQAFCDQEDGIEFWAQQWGRGKAHWVTRSGTLCNATFHLSRPFPAKATATICKYCEGRKKG